MAFDSTVYWQKPPEKRRRTIENSAKGYLSSQQIWDLMNDPARGWPYRRDKALLRRRDLALIALIYLLAVRASEAARITKSQFILQYELGRWQILGIQLSKVRSKSNPKWRERHARYREGWLPLKAKDPYRRQMVEVVIDYIKGLPLEGRVFPGSTRRILQIVNAYLGTWTHYLRMAGLQYLYDGWHHDIAAVSNYVKIDIRTLMHYLKGIERPPI